MNQSIRGAVLFFAVAMGTWAAPFAVVEGGDFTGNILSPFNLGVGVNEGVNTIVGALAGGSDLADSVTFTKPTDVSILAIRIITSGYSGTLVPGGLALTGAVTALMAVPGNGSFAVPFALGSGNSIQLTLTAPSGTLFAAGRFNYTVELVGAPEPASWAMIALGAVGLAINRRHRARA